MAEDLNQPQPTLASNRIQSLDLVRGVALLGILLLNILGFGLDSNSQAFPVGSAETDSLDARLNVQTWAVVYLFFEGSMRALFSLLFGAGVLLFLANGRDPKLHFKRNLWLLAFGFFDAYVLLWFGDILITYALASMLLYLLRDVSPKRLLVLAAALLALLTAIYGVIGFGLGYVQDAAIAVEQSDDPASLSELQRELAPIWTEFSLDTVLTPDEVQHELLARQSSYASAAAWNADVMREMWTIIPTFILADVLLLMLVGMAFYRWNILDASKSPRFYWKLALGGLAVGLGINGYEVWSAWSSDFALLNVVPFAIPTYDIGRTALALGYLGLLLLWCQSGFAVPVKARLAAVGRMALTHYLGQSLICLFVFTGAGFALVGKLQLWQLYIVVAGIWVIQIWLSGWWLARYRFGPAEWLWRTLTYGSPAPLRV